MPDQLRERLAPGRHLCPVCGREPLTERQAQVMWLYLQGWETKEVARKLGIVGATVRTMQAEARLRAGTSSRWELLIQMIEHGQVPVDSMYQIAWAMAQPHNARASSAAYAQAAVDALQVLEQSLREQADEVRAVSSRFRSSGSSSNLVLERAAASMM